MSYSAAAKTALIHKRLYRALLRAAKPFSPPSSNAAVLSCLLHRSFIPLEVDEKLAIHEQEAKDILPGVYVDIEEAGGSDPKRSDTHFLLFRRLLQEVFVGSGDDDEHQSSSNSNSNSNNNNSPPKKRSQCLQFPSQVKDRPLKLQDIIRREFRVPDNSTANDSNEKEERYSAGFTLQARRDCAFLALKRLNEKLVWGDQLEVEMAPPCPQQAAKYVTPIPPSGPPSSYLKPGTFLVAHPHLSGFFRKAVLVILRHGPLEEGDEDNNDHKDDDGEEFDAGTYGVVINRVSLHEISGKNRSLSDVMNVLPEKVVAAFGGFPIKEGGPVHMPSIQMLHACTPPDGGPTKHPSLEEIGGTRLPSIMDYSSEKAVYFRGDILKAAEAVKTEYLDRGTSLQICK
jgi:hypothetical protein